MGRSARKRHVSRLSVKLSRKTREETWQILLELNYLIILETIWQNEIDRAARMAHRMVLARETQRLEDIGNGRFSFELGFWPLLFNSVRLQLLYPLQEVLDRVLDRLNFFLPMEVQNATTQSPSTDLTSIAAYTVVVSALVLLALVYQYLLGSVHRGVSILYSSGSLDFRDTYICTLLFQGAYVWLKFREVAFKGVYRKQIPDKHGRITRVVYEPRFKPPRENGKVLQRIYVGQYATPDEASILYQIAAYYYNEDGGVLDLGEGRCFTIPPMGEEERRLTGMEKRAWVKVQTKKVYEDFKKEREKGVVEMFQEYRLLDWRRASQDQVTQGHGEVNMVVNDHSEASLPNTLYQQPFPVIQTHNLGMGITRGEAHGLDTGLLDGMGAINVPTVLSEDESDTLGVSTHDAQGIALPHGHAIGYQEECSVPVAQITPNTHSGLNFNTSHQLDLRQQISLQQEQLQDLSVQISELRHEQHLLQKQLQESKIQISQLQNQQDLQQQLQVFNQESLELPGGNGAENMNLRNYPGLTTLERDMW